MEFKDRLIQLRKTTNLYQADMAKKIGVARATYGAYEQGTRQPDFETLKKIADYFDVSTDYLLYGEENIRFIQGEKVDITKFSDRHKIILDWILSKESFSTIESEDELTKTLDEIGVIYDLIHNNKKENDNK